MECNKEEAVRAKGIAEKKMQNNDFAGARKIALKAQRLYPDLESISHIICVCDVQCSAEKIKFGNDRDWYDILKVEPSANDLSIKKQYRKLALLLHPDKNKFPGAEAAFMLIGEAQKVLLDGQKRSSFDISYRNFCQKTAPNPPQENKNAKNVQSPSVPKPPSSPNIMTKNGGSHVKKQPQQTNTFWTVCPICAYRYQYDRKVLDKNLICRNCKKNFIAYDMFARPNPPGGYAKQTNTFTHASNARSQVNAGQQQSGTNATQTAAFARRGVSIQGGSSNAANGDQQKPGANSFYKFVPRTQVGKSNKANQPNPGSKNTSSGNSNRARVSRDKKQKRQETVEKEVNAVAKAEKKQRLDFVAKFYGSSQSGHRKAVVENAGGASSVSQSKRHVSDVETGMNDETLNSLKRFKGNAQSSSSTRECPKVGSTYFTKLHVPVDKIDRSAVEIDIRAKGKAKENDYVAESDPQRSCKVDQSDSNLDDPSKLLVQEVRASDFNDFEQIRVKRKFRAKQIWSAYDKLDSMPRYYAQIKKVHSLGCKLSITWLEPDPDEDDAQSWADSDLPFSCGKFTQGNSETTEDLLMFSHPMSWKKGNVRSCIKIYPKKDETWALFRDWHMDWISNPHNYNKFEYEFVEVLSDYDESVGIRVAFLSKLKGFSCLFFRNGREEVQIPPSEYLKFSHRIPSYKMTGEEREGVPKGSLELDPASLPINLEEIPLPKEKKLGESAGESSISGVPSKLQVEEVRDSDFNDFEQMKKKSKFKVNQIWSVYDPLDVMPRYYAQIESVDSPAGKLSITWLAPHCDDIYACWADNDLPFSCGEFTLGYSETIDDLLMFSQPMSWEKGNRENCFKIYPKKDETWALFRDWHMDWMSDPHNHKKFEYDFVEILSDFDESVGIRVAFLSKLKGFSCLFCRNGRGEEKIPPSEYLKFSHRIPSYKMTGEEREGVPKGSLELDPASLPINLEEIPLPKEKKLGESAGESSISGVPSKLQVEEVRDSDFNDFEQIRKKGEFKVNQIWSVYDPLDVMPRYYAQIKSVESPAGKLSITWLAPHCDDIYACWADNDLPFSCGEFTLGYSETIDDLLMFSQPMSWEKGNRENCFKIYPKKDETWALFRDWHMDWMSDPHNHKKFEYEFVEILSDFDESVGIRVAFLSKLEGFSCLFCRNGSSEEKIPPSEYLRFSHRVPSYKMTAEERVGVPKGSLELDPASIPINLEEIPLPRKKKSRVSTGKTCISGSGLEGGNCGVMEKESGFQIDKPQDISDVVGEDLTAEASILEAFWLREPEFFNFHATRELGRFQVGQVWALYSDTDGLPKCYGQIRKIDQDSDLKLKIAWLEACLPKSGLNILRNKEMPMCCGKFKIKQPKLHPYYDSSPFSHQIQAKTLNKSVFEIYPRKGEIWAIYKNWNVDMTPSNLENCDYDLVEILEESIKGSSTKVLVLEHVTGYISVFKSKNRGNPSPILEIPYNHLLRFSHQIPAHILTEEKGGTLKGFKELDSSALPASFFWPKVR